MCSQSTGFTRQQRHMIDLVKPPCIYMFLSTHNTLLFIKIEGGGGGGFPMMYWLGSGTEDRKVAGSIYFMVYRLQLQGEFCQ